MKNLLFVACVFFFFGCGNSGNVIDYQSNDDLKLLSATMQEWKTGTVGAGQGKTVTLEVELKKTQMLQFDSLWSKEPTIKLDVTHKGGGEVMWEKGEVLQVYAVIYDNRAAGIPGPIPRATMHPAGYEGEGLMRYYVPGIEGARYIAVDEFDVLAPPN